MNERIKHFAKQTLSKDQFGLWLAGDDDIEQFAELIIKECMSIVSKSGNSKAEVLNDLEEFIWSKK